MTAQMPPAPPPPQQPPGAMPPNGPPPSAPPSGGRSIGRDILALLAWVGPQRFPRAAEAVLGLWHWLTPSGPVLLPSTAAPHHAPEHGGRLLALSNSYPLANWRPLARAVMVAVGLFLVWASLASLEEVSIANGEVVPEGKVKVIQHLEGGVVREIYVHDGAEVHEGAPLLQLDLSASSINRDELQVRLDGL
ncbi:MAG: HlyD family type I secretion periplasmic adaptor subunit, partial [Magnetospirillum sp.]|nr:HlyD family type I secretion periplasmic adaptor subunit [Magnetospirillum sp.]